MIRKVLVTVTSAAVIAAMTACASGSLLYDQVKDSISEEQVQEYINEAADAFIAESESIAAAAQGDSDILNDISSEPYLEIDNSGQQESTAAIAMIGEDETTQQAAESDAQNPEEATSSVQTPSSEPDTTPAAVENETTAAAAERETSAFGNLISEKETAASDESTEAAEDGKTGNDAAVTGDNKTEEIEETVIVLDDDTAYIDGRRVGRFITSEVFVGAEIVYYDQDAEYKSGNEYGNASKAEMFSAEDAEENTVLTIAAPGRYRLTGTWKGQINVNLGEEARTDETAVVTLVLDDAQVECSVAPAIVFVNAYECSTVTDETEEAVDEEAAAVNTDSKDQATDEKTADSKDQTADEKTADSKDQAADEKTADSKDQTNNETAITESPFDNMTEEEFEDFMKQFFFGTMSGSSSFSAPEDITADSDAAAEDTQDNTASIGSKTYAKDDSTSVISNKEETAGKEDQTSIFNNNDNEDVKDAEAIASSNDTNDADAKDVTDETETQDLTAPDTTGAGAVILIAEGSDNTVIGKHVAEIYTDSKIPETLVKQGGAIYSYVTLNIEAEETEEDETIDKAAAEDVTDAAADSSSSISTGTYDEKDADTAAGSAGSTASTESKDDEAAAIADIISAINSALDSANAAEAKDAADAADDKTTAEVKDAADAADDKTTAEVKDAADAADDNTTAAEDTDSYYDPDTTGILNVIADKHGICSEGNLTVNGGHINVLANEEGLCAEGDSSWALTINGGTVRVLSGDEDAASTALETTGCIFINGGNTVLSTNPDEGTAFASGMGTAINGGMVLAYGSEDEPVLHDTDAVTICLNFAETQDNAEDILITDENGKTVFEFSVDEDEMLSAIQRGYKTLVISSPVFEKDAAYNIYIGDQKLEYAARDELRETEPALDELIYKGIDLYILSDLFDHFGIEMSEVEEYVENEAAEEEIVTDIIDAAEEESEADDQTDLTDDYPIFEIIPGYESGSSEEDFPYWFFRFIPRPSDPNMPIDSNFGLDEEETTAYSGQTNSDTEKISAADTKTDSAKASEEETVKEDSKTDIFSSDKADTAKDGDKDTASTDEKTEVSSANSKEDAEEENDPTVFVMINSVNSFYGVMEAEDQTDLSSVFGKTDTQSADDAKSDEKTGTANSETASDAKTDANSSAKNENVSASNNGSSSSVKDEATVNEKDNAITDSAISSEKETAAEEETTVSGTGTERVKNSETSSALKGGEEKKVSLDAVGELSLEKPEELVGFYKMTKARVR